jgi:hypothetical protein
MPKRTPKPTPRPPVYTPRGIRTAQQPGQPTAAAAAAMFPAMAMMGAMRPEIVKRNRRGGRR